MTNAQHLQRVLALRLRGQWSASADDGVHIGHGAGFSWEEAVREAVRELDEKRAVAVEVAVKEQS